MFLLLRKSETKDFFKGTFEELTFPKYTEDIYQNDEDGSVEPHKTPLEALQEIMAAPAFASYNRKPPKLDSAIPSLTLYIDDGDLAEIAEDLRYDPSNPEGNSRY